ncbi:hypothetical protein Tco_0965623 [Tanacetum coccineum]
MQRFVCDEEDSAYSLRKRNSDRYDERKQRQVEGEATQRPANCAAPVARASYRLAPSEMEELFPYDSDLDVWEQLEGDVGSLHDESVPVDRTTPLDDSQYLSSDPDRNPGFLSSILLVMVIIVAVVIVMVIWVVIFVDVIVGVVIVVAIIGVVVFVTIIGIVVVGGGVPSIIKLSFVIIGWAYAFHQDKASSVKVPVANVTLSSSAHLLRENTDSFPLFATGISLGLVFLLGLLALAYGCRLCFRATVNQQSVAGLASKVYGLVVSRLLDVLFRRHSIQQKINRIRNDILSLIPGNELDNVVEGKKMGMDIFASFVVISFSGEITEYRGSNSSDGGYGYVNIARNQSKTNTRTDDVIKKLKKSIAEKPERSCLSPLQSNAA